MGQGLGKNSPITLTFGKENYESLILRHGQWMRWRRAIKCPCTKYESMEVDIHCERCGGSGLFYTYQKDLIVTQTLGITDYSGIIEVSEEYAPAALEMVYDYQGKKYPAEKCGTFIFMEDTPIKGEYLSVVMRQPTLKTLEEGIGEPAGGGYFRVQGLRSRRAGIDGLYHTAPGDIESIDTIVDATGREYQAREFRSDMVYVTPHEVDGQVQAIMEPLTLRGVHYVPPVIFALLNQELSKADVNEVMSVKGNGVLTFPYTYDVADGDILTVLSGTYTQKEVVNRVADTDDVIGAYFVMDINSCIGINREYQKGTDYIVAGTNRIKWLCEDAPEPGEAYSIIYQIYPTYKVVKSIPQIRTSENQRLPKKAVVQLYGTYGEHKGVNRQ